MGPYGETRGRRPGEETLCLEWMEGILRTGRLSMLTCPFPSPCLNPGYLVRFLIPTSASEVQVHQYLVCPQPPDLKRMVLAPQQCCSCCILELFLVQPKGLA